jgi:hypothetical protein
MINAPLRSATCRIAAHRLVSPRGASQRNANLKGNHTCKPQ